MDSNTVEVRCERTSLEILAEILRPSVNLVMALTLLGALLAMVAVAGQLAERILASVSASAAGKFPNDYLHGVPVWIGGHFAALVKAGFWAAALAAVTGRCLRMPSQLGVGAVWPMVTLLVGATYLLAAWAYSDSIAAAMEPLGSAERVEAGSLRAFWLFLTPGQQLLAVAGEWGPLSMLLVWAWAVITVLIGAALTGETVPTEIRSRLSSGIAPMLITVGLAAVILGLTLADALLVGPLTKCSILVPMLVLALAAAEYVLHASKAPAIAVREFKALMLNPLGWGVLAAFSLVLALLFTFAVDGLTVTDPTTGQRSPLPSTDPAGLQPLTAFFGRWALSLGFLVLIPIVTMRLVSEERRRGTVEMLLTSPVEEWHIALGKFLGALGFYVVLWSLSLVHLFLLDQMGTPNRGVEALSAANGLSGLPVASAYLGLLLIGSGFLAMGLFCSCLVSDQLASAVLTLLGMLLFTLVPIFVEVLPLGGSWDWLREAAGYLDLRRHLEWSARGTPDSRTVFLFLSMTMVFLFLSVRALEARRWNDMNLGRFGLFWRILAVPVALLLVGSAGWAVLSVKTMEALQAAWPSTLWTGAAADPGLQVALLVGGLGLVGGLVLSGDGLRRVVLLSVGPAGVAAWAAWRLARAVPAPPDDFDWTGPMLWAVVSGLTGLVLLLAATPRLAVLSLTNKLISGANVVVCSLGMVVIAVMANYLAVRYHVHLDWSPEETFTLRPEGVGALAGLPADVDPLVHKARTVVDGLAEAHGKAVAENNPKLFTDPAQQATELIKGVSAAAGPRRKLREAIRKMESASAVKAGTDADADAKTGSSSTPREKGDPYDQPTLTAAQRAEVDRKEALALAREAADELRALRPDDGAAIADGEFVEAIVFVGRYDPPKDREESNDNFRRATLERLLSRYADSLNRPGNLKFRYEFVDPRDSRSAGRIAEFRKRYGIEGSREILLRFNNRHSVVRDSDLFEFELTTKRFAELCARWKREYEEGRHFTLPPVAEGERGQNNYVLWQNPKTIPPESREYLPRAEDLELFPRREGQPGERSGRLRGDITERVLTNAILRLVRGQLNVVYFTQGHGERSLFADTSDAGEGEKSESLKIGAERDREESAAGRRIARQQREIQGLRQLLVRNNFQVRPLNAAESQGGADVPADASAVVVCGATEDFTVAEVLALDRYLRRGGRLVLMLDPRGGVPGGRRPPGEPPADQPRKPLTNLLALSANYGLVFEDAVAVMRGLSLQFGRPTPTPPQLQIPLLGGPLELEKSQAAQQEFYNTVVLAQGNAGHPILRSYAESWRRESDPILPLTMFYEATPLAQNGRGKFTALVTTGRSGAPGGSPASGMFRWSKHRLTGGTPEEADNPFGEATPSVVMAVAEPLAEPPARAGFWTELFHAALRRQLILRLSPAPSGPSAQWRVIGLGDSDWCCDGPVGGASEDLAGNPRQTPSFLNHWLRGGERLALALFTDVCAAPPELDVRPKLLKPFRANTRPERRGELILNVRLDVSADRLAQLVESVRDSLKKTDEYLAASLTLEPHDQSRIYGLRLPSGTDVTESIARLQADPSVVEVRESLADGSIKVKFAPGSSTATVAALVKSVNANETPELVRNQWRLSFRRDFDADRVAEKLLARQQYTLTEAGHQSLQSAGLDEPTLTKLVKLRGQAYGSLDRLEAAAGWLLAEQDALFEGPVREAAVQAAAKGRLDADSFATAGARMDAKSIERLSPLFGRTGETADKLELLMVRRLLPPERTAQLKQVRDAARPEIESTERPREDLLLRAAVMNWAVLPGLLLLAGLGVYFVRRWE